MKQQKKAAFMTLGCKVNTYDSEALMEIFETNGYEIVGFGEIADVYVINTCTVTHLGDRKSRNMMRKAKRLNPDAIICAVGCYVQVSPEEVAKIDEVDVMIGTKNRHMILEDIEEHIQNKNKRSFVSNIMNEKTFEPLVISEVKGKTRAFIKIQEGCNQFCTYCIIPYARGPIRSRAMTDIILEVKRLVDNGYKEVVLTGIHIASYGVDLGNVDLIILMEELDAIKGLKRIRLGSIEPKFMTTEHLDRLKKLETFCPHFHLSLQSGSDTVLARMKRRYTTKEYFEIVQEIRKRFPLASLTTDIMVGFPGETQHEFDETIAFVKKVAFYKVHEFKYSRRKGTKAADFVDQIDNATKTQRGHILAAVSKELEIEFLKKNHGEKVHVLFEANIDGNVQEGHTENFIPVLYQTDEKINGNIIQLRVKYQDSELDKLVGQRF